MVKTYREGPVGALLDEYERAADEFKNVLSDIDAHHFLAIVDHETSDPDCVSVERILNHVVNAGYGYANLIRKQFGDALTEKIQAKPMQTPQDACLELDQMLHYTAETLENKMQITLEEILNNLIKVSWGQQYDFEQLLEHAIVHVLRLAQVFSIKIPRHQRCALGLLGKTWTSGDHAPAWCLKVNGEYLCQRGDFRASRLSP